MSLIDLRLNTIWGSVNEQSKQVKISGIIRGSLPHPSTAWSEDVAAPNAMRVSWHPPGLMFSPALYDRPVTIDDLGQC